MSHFTCTLEQDPAGTFVATCIEMDLTADGATKQEALGALKQAIEEQLLEPQAVAPPSRPDIDPVELDVVPRVS